MGPGELRESWQQSRRALQLTATSSKVYGKGKKSGLQKKNQKRKKKERKEGKEVPFKQN